MTKKFTELTADAAPTGDDLIATSNDPSGTPASKKVTLANLFAAFQTFVFGSDAGATDTYVVTLVPAPSAYVTGQNYRFKANTANTGAATINFNGLGPITIVKVAGGITTALADNDIRAGQWVDLVYDGTNMQMQSTLGNVGGGISGLTTGTIPKAASSTTLNDSGLIQSSSTRVNFADATWTFGWGTGGGAIGFSIVSAGIQASGGDLICTSFRTSNSSPGVYISGNVSNAGGIGMKNNQNVGWASGSDGSAAQDIGMSRFGAGSMEINKGNPTSAGSQTDLRDVILRSLTVSTALNSAADAGSTDDYAITLSPAITAYQTGQMFSFKANTANTGAATLNVNGIGAKTIVKLQGGITTALANNDIRAGQYVIVIYDGTNMQMMSQLGN